MDLNRIIEEELRTYPNSVVTIRESTLNKGEFSIYLEEEGKGVVFSIPLCNWVKQGWTD